MAVDDSAWIPKPPPPRPARRDAAIEAALQRFDGTNESPPAAREERARLRSTWWEWGRRPQFGLAITVCLIVVIGLPAALIVIRDGSSRSIQASAPPLPVVAREGVVPCAAPDCAAQDAVAPEAPPAQSSVELAARAPSVASQLQQTQDKVATAAANKPVSEAIADEPSAMAYAAPPAPPPAPPPPAAPMVAEKSAEGATSNGIVVTGSLIAAPKLDREESAAGRARSTDAQAAPNWVLKDHSYAAFLTRLQAAVGANDRGAVIKLIGFPLRVNSNGRSRLYRDPASVRADYDRIFTSKVSRAILGQRFDRLFGRDQGLMIGDGEIWFDHVCSNSTCSHPGPVRIKAVNP